ncbi:hypothetical protein M2283_000119 [Streptomyces pseudovenezuelae]|uniref:EfeO-type cupredoxin-like domain-containing protein n=1 Tax=Streptomyces pseudovenezuelae TaxID=67350 RepID=A0ABT6L941_9ACTN|nr:hypothetical protein [Streptomyces pseudovenezuelae]
MITYVRPSEVRVPFSGLKVTPLRLTGAFVLVLVLALTGVLVARHSPGQARAADDGLRHTTVEVSAGHCGRGWTDPASGEQVFDLHNTSAGPAEVYLENPTSKAVYGEVEDIGPGTTRALTVRLGKGAYAFKCVPDDADAVTRPSVSARDAAVRRRRRSPSTT